MDNSRNRYSVLLVDDEEDIIRIIMKKLDWESMGLTVIGHAANGVEALEMAGLLENRPDPEDRRKHRLVPTEKAAALIAEGQSRQA